VNAVRCSRSLRWSKVERPGGARWRRASGQRANPALDPHPLPALAGWDSACVAGDGRLTDHRYRQRARSSTPPIPAMGDERRSRAGQRVLLAGQSVPAAGGISFHHGKVNVQGGPLFRYIPGRRLSTWCARPHHAARGLPGGSDLVSEAAYCCLRQHAKSRRPTEEARCRIVRGGAPPRACPTPLSPGGRPRWSRRRRWSLAGCRFIREDAPPQLHHLGKRRIASRASRASSPWPGRSGRRSSP
jgi:hypothetical protein